MTKAAEKDAVEDHLLDDFSFGSDDDYQEQPLEDARAGDFDQKINNSIVSDARWSIVGV